MAILKEKITLEKRGLELDPERAKWLESSGFMRMHHVCKMRRLQKKRDELVGQSQHLPPADSGWLDKAEADEAAALEKVEQDNIKFDKLQKMRDDKECLSEPDAAWLNDEEIRRKEGYLSKYTRIKMMETMLASLGQKLPAPEAAWLVAWRAKNGLVVYNTNIACIKLLEAAPKPGEQLDQADAETLGLTRGTVT